MTLLIFLLLPLYNKYNYRSITISQESITSLAFELAIYELLLELTRGNERLSKKITKKIYEEMKAVIEIIGWRTKRDSQKRISLIIYDILQETKNKHLMQREDTINEVTEKIVDLAIEDL